MKPKSEADVGVIALVTQQKLPIRTYTPSYQTDLQWILTVQIFNWPQGELIDSNVFEGSKPGNKSGAPASYHDSYGSKPVEKIATWLDRYLEWR
jgi:hypothetical protein